MKIQAYVINLDPRSARMASIEGILRGHGMSFERIAAIDGRAFDLATVAVYDADAATRYMGRSLVGGEVGCYLSHLEAARTFLRSDADYGIVLEDDARPLCALDALLREVIPVLNDQDPRWRVINVGHNRHRIATPIRSFATGGGEESVLYAAHYFPMTTSGLVWSRAGAQAFVDKHRRIFAPVDNFFRYWLTREGHGYAMWPAPVATIDAESEITLPTNNVRRLHERKWFYGFAKKKRLIEDKLIAMAHKRRFRLSGDRPS